MHWIHQLLRNFVQLLDWMLDGQMDILAHDILELALPESQTKRLTQKLYSLISQIPYFFTTRLCLCSVYDLSQSGLDLIVLTKATLISDGTLKTNMHWLLKTLQPTYLRLGFVYDFFCQS